MISETFEIIVTGESMWPLLVPGKRYTARRDVEPQLGDIVVAQHPADPAQMIVKRIVRIQGPEFRIQDNPNPRIPTPEFYLAGTVNWSSTFVVTRPQILGVVVC